MIGTNGNHLFFGEFRESLPLPVGLSVPTLGHHVGVVDGIGSGKQVGKLATGGRIAGVTDDDIVREWTMGINVGGAVDEPETALPPYASVSVLGDVPLPQSAAGNFIADGVEIDLLRETGSSGRGLSGHRPSYHRIYLKETFNGL